MVLSLSFATTQATDGIIILNMAYTKQSTAEIVLKAEQLELEMHEFATKTMQTNAEITYQQGINMFLLLKIAELKYDTDLLFKTSKSIYDAE